MSHTCPHCGKPVNPAQMLGNVKSPKKEAAAKANGERLRRMYANAKKLEEDDTPTNQGTVAFDGNTAINTMTGERRDMSGPSIYFPIPPMPTTLEGKKAAAMAALAKVTRGSPEFVESEKAKWGQKFDDLHETPRAPFDLNLEGEPHRVTSMGKRLGLFFCGGGEPVFNRYLAEGELERFWEMRDIK